ncbi:MAG: hypothetical protein INR62_02685 [Rhodospirillales bacterium]|nr:hypothetical protein [Acetobacter sp.]
MNDISPVVEAASWRIATEICRASPSVLIRQTHPGGGQYDCLSLRDEAGRHFADLNRKGTLHIFARFDGREPEKESWDAWPELLRLDITELVAEMRRRLGQDLPTRLSSSTPRVLLYRFVAACLGMHAFARGRWSCVSVAHDSSGSEGCYVRPEAREFAGLSAELGGLASDWAAERAPHWWLLMKNDSPLLALCDNGRVGTLSGDTCSLPDIYRNSGGVAPALWHLLGPHLDL